MTTTETPTTLPPIVDHAAWREQLDELRRREKAATRELDAIAAAFIGGAAVQGGVGKVVGAITGGLIMGVINNGMSLYGAKSETVLLVKGAVLLAAVAFDVWSKRRAAATR